MMTHYGRTVAAISPVTAGLVFIPRESGTIHIRTGKNIVLDRGVFHAAGVDGVPPPRLSSIPDSILRLVPAKARTSPLRPGQPLASSLSTDHQQRESVRARQCRLCMAIA